MFFIRQGATHKVVLGPAVAVGDGFTPVTTLALSTADEAEAILHDNGTIVDIAAYTWAAITTADGYYHLTLQSGISGTVGHLTIVVNDDSLCLPLRADFTVLEEAVYDQLYAAAAPGAATPTAVDTIDNFLDTEIAAITAAVITNAAGVDIAADIIAIKAETAAIVNDTDVIDDVTSGLVKIAQDVAAVLVDTAEIGAAGAGLTALATQTSVNTIDDFIDTEVAAIKAKTDSLTFTVANQVDANAIAISGDATAADRLESLMDGIIVAQINDLSATTTAFAADGFTEATDDHFNGRLITFISGALSGQQTDITDYDAAGHVQGSQAFVVTALTEAPADGDFFVVH